MRKLTILIITVAITTAFSGCCDNVKSIYNNLSTEQLSVWKTGDVLTYTNDAGGSKKFRVTYDGFGYEVKSNDDWCNTKVYNQFNSVVMFSADSVATGEPHCLIKNIDGADEELILRLEGSFVNIKTAEQYLTRTIAGKAYSYVFKYIDATENIDSIFYSTKYGFLQYFNKEGQVWTLNNSKYDPKNP